MRVAVSFTNLGPYHLARLRALAIALARRGDTLVAIETAGCERRYPWLRSGEAEPFERATLFPDTDLESIPASACRSSIRRYVDGVRPDAIGVVGYARPESAALLAWGRTRGVPTVLLSESQEIDWPRVWWKEAIKRRRVARADTALVGGPSHAAYLVRLGMPPDRIRLGYNAVDNAEFARLADRARRDPTGRVGLPGRPFFLAASRFVPEKNLDGLIAAFARYRSRVGPGGWDLALIGGGAVEVDLRREIEAKGVVSSVHLPGFLQIGELARWLAHASAFIHPSRMEPWGLVVNEAAACGLPLLISRRAGCAATLVPEPPGTTGWRFDPDSIGEMADALIRMAALDEAAREPMGRRATEVVGRWGPERFASGMIEALELAREVASGRRVVEGVGR